jgi:hypothetical protein
MIFISISCNLAKVHIFSLSGRSYSGSGLLYLAANAVIFGENSLPSPQPTGKEVIRVLLALNEAVMKLI